MEELIVTQHVGRKVRKRCTKIFGKEILAKSVRIKLGKMSGPVVLCICRKAIFFTRTQPSVVSGQEHKDIMEKLHVPGSPSVSTKTCAGARPAQRIDDHLTKPL